MFIHSKCSTGVSTGLGIALLLLSSPPSAKAKPVRARQVVSCSVKSGCSDWNKPQRRLRQAAGRRHHMRHGRAMAVDANGNIIRRAIGGRPAGCPHAYCGCGLAQYLGLHDKRLWNAWNWARLFPRASPHAGAVAVRHHHVMLLVRHIRGEQWLVRSYNGGHHLSWLYVVSVQGYVFVNPRASSLLASIR